MKENQVTIPKDFSAAVKDIKLAILQARARAARVSNVEALKRSSHKVTRPRVEIAND